MPREYCPVTADVLARLRLLVAAGESPSAICETLGVTVRRYHRLRRLAGIPRLSKSEVGRLGGRRSGAVRRSDDALTNIVDRLLAAKPEEREVPCGRPAKKWAGDDDSPYARSPHGDRCPLIPILLREDVDPGTPALCDADLWLRTEGADLVGRVTASVFDGGAVVVLRHPRGEERFDRVAVAATGWPHQGKMERREKRKAGVAEVLP